MSQLKKLVKSMASASRRSSDGLKKVKSTTSQQKAVIGDTNIMSNKKTKKKLLSTPEFLPKSKNMIYKDKQIFSNKNILNIRLSSQKLRQELTTNEKNLKPFWTNYSQEISKKLLHTHQTELDDLGLNLSDSSLQNFMPNSYLQIITTKKHPKKKLQKILFPSLHLSVQNIMDQENTKKEKTKGKKKGMKQTDVKLITRKIRFYPSSDLKKYFSKCFGVCRYLYNTGVTYINETYEKRKKEFNKIRKKGCIHMILNKKKTTKKVINKLCQCCGKLEDGNYFCDKHKKQKLKWNISSTFIGLKKINMKANKQLTKDEEWQSEIPHDIRALTFKDLATAYKSAMTNKIRGNIKQFKLTYRKKKSIRQTFHMPSKFLELEKHKFFTSFLKNKIISGMNETKQKKKIIPIDSSFTFPKKEQKWINKLGNKFENTVTVLKEYGKYYICTTFPAGELITKNRNEVCSIDPGVRTFATLYSPDGIIGEIGKGTSDYILKLALRIDELISELNKKYMKKENRKNKMSRKKINTRRHNMRRKILKLRSKIKGIIRDLHTRTSNFLCNNFKVIAMPEFNDNNEMVKKGRKLKNVVVRKMLSLSHGAFREKLTEMASRRDTKIIFCKENHTSKTCGKCGKLHEELGSNKAFKCPHCSYESDRDMNGARNILLKLITEYNE